MATLSENLKIIKDSTADIKQAIINKGGTINGNITTWANSINNIPSGGSGGSSSKKGDVTFYDYDGTILHSFSKDEFLALNELPSLPTQPGLICQEWNWSYEDAIEYVTEYGVLDVGATYITDDGKTRLYIRIAAEGRMDVPLYFQQTFGNGVTIDWGDGSATETLDSTGYVNTTHRYTSIGDYMISLDVVDGCKLILGHSTNGYCVMGSNGNNGRVYCNMLQKVEIGNGVTSIGAYTFKECYSLSYITIHSLCTSFGSSVFTNAKSLISVIIPYGVKSCTLNFVNGCCALTTIVMPNSVTSLGASAIRQCYSLSSIVLPRLTSIGNYIFQENHSLSSVVLPNSMNIIASQQFTYCYSLISIVIPPSVTVIDASAFSSCYGMAFYDLSSHIAVPTLQSPSAFASIPSDCKIIVPDSLYDSWIAATNWATYESNIIKKSDWDALQN